MHSTKAMIQRIKSLNEYFCRLDMAEGDPKIGTNDSWSGKPINLSTLDNDIPTLYHAGESNCSQLVRLVFEEEGIQWNSRSVKMFILS